MKKRKKVWRREKEGAGGQEARPRPGRGDDRRRDAQDAGRAEGGGGQDAGGQVQLLLLDDRGVHLKLDSAGKRADEGEKEEWLKKRKKEEVFKIYKGNTSLA